MTDKQPPPRADHNTQSSLLERTQLQTSLLERELGSHTAFPAKQWLASAFHGQPAGVLEVPLRQEPFLTVGCGTVNDSTASMTHRPAGDRQHTAAAACCLTGVTCNWRYIHQAVIDKRVWAGF